MVTGATRPHWPTHARRSGPQPTRFGGLDVLVNCVGIFDFYRGLADLDDKQLDAASTRSSRVNVKSQLVCGAGGPARAAPRGGSVVLTVSTSGFYPGRGGVLYVASKFAVRGCVIALAHELAPQVRVNGVAPGGHARHRADRAAQPRPGRIGSWAATAGTEQDLRSGRRCTSR